MYEIHVHASALKHGLDRDSVIQMWRDGFEETQLDDDEPPRYIRIALDRSGRPWELAALKFDGGNRHLVIHAMPARKSVIAKIQRRKR